MHMWFDAQIDQKILDGIYSCTSVGGFFSNDISLFSILDSIFSLGLSDRFKRFYMFGRYHFKIMALDLFLNEWFYVP